MKKQSKKWMLVVLALLAMVALPLVGCKNDSVSETRGEIEQTPPADGTETGDNEDVPVKYTITFNTDGGSTVQSQPVESGKTATEPSPVPTKTGYTFAGWYSNSDLTKPYSFSSPVTGDIPLYAKWAPNKVSIQVELPKNPQTGKLDNSAYAFTANFDKDYDTYTWYVDSEKQVSETGKTFTWDTSAVDAGWYEIMVEVEDNDARTRVEVKK